MDLEKVINILMNETTLKFPASVSHDDFYTAIKIAVRCIEKEIEEHQKLIDEVDAKIANK